MAFTFFMRFLTEGFVKNVRFLNSFNTPDRSYFFLNRFKARSIGSFSFTTIPTKNNHLLKFANCYTVSIYSAGRFSTNRRDPNFSKVTRIARPPLDVFSFPVTFPISSQSE